MPLEETAALAASMLEDKMSQSGQIGRSVTPVYTFDGDPTGKVTAEIFPMVYVKISNDTPDLNGIVDGSGFLHGEALELGQTSLIIESTEFGQTATAANLEATVVLSVTKATAEIPEPGLYVYTEEDSYISRVEFAETIHPIDPKYLPEGGVGYTEVTPGINIKWDGSVEGKEYVSVPSGDGTAVLCKVSDKVFTVEELLGATVVNFNGRSHVLMQETVTEPALMGFPVSGGALVTTEQITDVISIKACTMDMDGIVVTFPSDGTYFFGIPGIAHTSELTKEDTETIHPIDKKYLPGVCLPVVELTTEPGVNADAELTTAECAALNAAYEKKDPIVCQFGLMGMTVSVPMLYVNSPATSSGYIAGSPVGNLYLTVTEAGTWTARFEA